MIANNAMALPLNSLLQNRYEIKAIIGAGGFGITYLAWDTVLEKNTAIKEYFPNGLVSRTENRKIEVYLQEQSDEYQQGKERFLREARELTRFSNCKNVVSVFDFFEANNTAYMVMEYLQGTTLKNYMEQKGGRIEESMAINVIFTLMDTLEIVHSAGVIHRDIAPDNVYICSDNTVKLLDFGAAKQAMTGEMKSASVILKPGYAPVEQYTKSGKIGPWTDIYAFGAMIYHMMTGVRPVDSVERTLGDQLPSPRQYNPQINPAMEKVILKAMAVRAEDRYQTINEMRQDYLTGLSGGTDDRTVVAANQNVIPDQSIPTVPDPVGVSYSGTAVPPSGHNPNQQQGYPQSGNPNQRPVYPQSGNPNQQPVYPQSGNPNQQPVYPQNGGQNRTEDDRQKREGVKSTPEDRKGQKGQKSFGYKKVLMITIPVAVLLAGILIFVMLGRNSGSGSSGGGAVTGAASGSSNTQSAETSDTTTKTTTKKTENTTAKPVTEATTAVKASENKSIVVGKGDFALDISGWDASKKIYAYSWDDDFQRKLNVVLDSFPEIKPYVEYINLGVSSEESLAIIDSAFATDRYPSLIPADISSAKYWIEDDSKTLDLRSIGFTDATLANSYKYARDFGKFNGQIKAVTWQNTAGSIFYNRAIAQWVFGTDDPAAIQNKLKDWDSFFAAADELKSKGYKIVSGPDDIYYAVINTHSDPWVQVKSNGDPVFKPDDTIETYLNISKKLSDGNYTNGTSLWSAEWFGSMKNGGNVFCYFACPWMIGVFQGNGASDGAWGACVGPDSYYWGGTYVSVGKDTPNPELCAFILYELTCDPDIAVKITNQTGDAVNNIEANARLNNGEIAKDNNGVRFLGGQNPYATWAEAAPGIRQDAVTYLDKYYDRFILDAATGYNAGTYKSVKEAIDYIRKQSETEYGIPAE